MGVMQGEVLSLCQLVVWQPHGVRDALPVIEQSERGPELLDVRERASYGAQSATQELRHMGKESDYER